MKPSLVAAVLLMLFLSPLFGQERGLEFLSNIPEFRGLSLKMSENQFKSHIKKYGLYARTKLQDAHRSYWLLTPRGENVFVGFAPGKCTGIQRMQPIPKAQIEEAIGASEYRAWMAKRKAEPGGPANRSRPVGSETNRTPAGAGSSR